MAPPFNIKPLQHLHDFHGIFFICRKIRINEVDQTPLDKIRHIKTQLGQETTDTVAKTAAKEGLKLCGDLINGPLSIPVPKEFRNPAKIALMGTTAFR